MKGIVIPPADRISYYLACEEYIAKHIQGDCWFMWEPVRPTVVVGRNQLISDEVNIDFCRQHGIDLVRRKSGGGCIFADEGCIFYSFVSSRDLGVTAGFEEYNGAVSRTLRAAGLPVEVSGRNDIMLDGRKIAGAAYYVLNGRSILHTTMLFRTNIETLVRAITPPDEKLISKGIHSVRQRVVNSGEYTSMTQRALTDFMRTTLCDEGSVVLPQEAIEEILETERKNRSEEFVFGSNPVYTVVRSTRIPSVGGIQANVDLKDEKIHRIRLTGDFFFEKDINESLNALLAGIPFAREAVAQALAGSGNLGVAALTPQQLVDLLFG